jgi:WhiB family redox-sensing transcriptional regulator
MDWQNDAACLSEDPDLFFPIGTTGDAVAQIVAAKSICATCPVLSTCLEFALDSRQDYGVWGGLTEDERRSLRRSRQRRARRLAVAAA